MNTLTNKTKSAVSTIALFAIGSVMAVLGFAVMGSLALFAVFAIGLALLAAPFVGMAQQSETVAAQTDEAPADTAATAA